MEKKVRIILSTALLLLSYDAVAQFVIINATIINTDSGLLKILTEKLAVNTAILVEQKLIYDGLTDIKNSKIEIRSREFEKNKYDNSLKVPLATNLAINNLLIGTVIATPTKMPFYHTAAKNEYFIRELAINNAIALQMALSRNANIRNVNTQELHSLNRKMLNKLKKTNENPHRNAAFILLTSLLAQKVSLSGEDLNQILKLGL